jgi:hypothetical protein
MAMKSRMRLTLNDPTFFPADSKAMAVVAQQKAANKPAISPKYDSMCYVFSFCLN